MQNFQSFTLNTKRSKEYS